MERYGIDADRAFDYLRRISQDTNQKLVVVADELVRNRLPDVEASSNHGTIQAVSWSVSATDQGREVADKLWSDRQPNC